LNQTHEAVLVQKTDTINRLTVNLEENQRQCQELMANVDNGQTVAHRERERERATGEICTATGSELLLCLFVSEWILILIFDLRSIDPHIKTNQ
jgi:hypothetical protein